MVWLVVRRFGDGVGAEWEPVRGPGVAGGDVDGEGVLVGSGDVEGEVDVGGGFTGDGLGDGEFAVEVAVVVGGGDGDGLAVGRQGDGVGGDGVVGGCVGSVMV